MSIIPASVILYGIYQDKQIAEGKEYLSYQEWLKKEESKDENK